MKTILINASNIKCGGCVSRIKEGISSIGGIDNVDVDIESGQVRIEGETLNENAIRQELMTLGYPAGDEK